VITRPGPAAVSLLLAGGLAALSNIVGPSPASADGDSYIQKLQDAGISTLRGEYELKEWGHEVCALRSRGKPPRQWVEQGVWNDQLHPPYGLTMDQANFIVETAVSELCEDRDGPPPHLPLPGGPIDP
jgi:hypothetical protein